MVLFERALVSSYRPFILIYQRYRRTDIQTTCNLKPRFALVYSASRGKNTDNVLVVDADDSAYASTISVTSKFAVRNS